jgi:hypothetical protein
MDTGAGIVRNSTRLKIAAEEVGVICDDDSSDERGAAGANRLPLFPD